MIENLEKICAIFLTTISRIKLYGLEHPYTKKVAIEFIQLFEKTIISTKLFKIIISKDSIIFNDQILSNVQESLYILAKKLSSCGIGYLEIKSGLNFEEFLNFSKEIANYPKEKIRATSHILLGEIHYLPKIQKESIEDLSIKEYKGEVKYETSEEIKEIEYLNNHIKEHLEVKTKNFESIVFSFLKNFAKKSNLFLNIANIKEHHKFTYLHSANVSNIVIGLGIALGFDKKEVFNFGIAALLHDIGKVFVPEKILSKPGRLTNEEWEIVKKHPIFGASILMKQKNIIPSAVVVAFEHHIHFTGLGGYPKCSPPRKPCPLSQIVSIADCFDALFAKRSYHDRYDILEALSIVQDSAGSIYNPYLVEIFSKFMNLSLEEI